jgi:hypothetical protein
VKVSGNTAERVLASAFAHEGARAVQTAVLLGMFDRLAQSGVSARAVATACGTHPGATAILLDALVGLGLPAAAIPTRPTRPATSSPVLPTLSAI